MYDRSSGLKSHTFTYQCKTVPFGDTITSSAVHTTHCGIKNKVGKEQMFLLTEFSWLWCGYVAKAEIPLMFTSGCLHFTPESH